MSTGAVQAAAVNLSAGYGGAAVVRNLDFELCAGEVTVILGSNGAGKTTTLLALAGELPIMEGHVVWQGEPTDQPLWKRARDGLAYIPSEHAVIRSLSVRDNLRLGFKDPGVAFAMFPELVPHKTRLAGFLSGGQQKMLSLAMTLAKDPAVVFADEMSLGLAPIIVQRLLESLRAAADRGAAVVLVEQHARQALSVGDRAIVLTRGRIAVQDTAANLRRNFNDLSSAYLGGHA